MSPYAKHRRYILDGVRNLITQAKQVNAGSDAGALYPDFLLEDMRLELGDLEQGAIRWYLNWVRQMFYPFPRTPRAFVARLRIIWKTLFRPLPPIKIEVKPEGALILDYNEAIRQYAADADAEYKAQNPNE